MSQPVPVQSSPFATDVLKLVTGTTIAQIIAILASPILTRLYGPEAFGFFALFTSITAIVGVIACMRYELAIMLPRDDGEAVNLLALCFLMVAIISSLTGIGLFFGGSVLLTLLQAPDLAPYLWLVPPFVFVSGVFLALNYWNSRTRLFGRLSIARITQAVTTTGTQLGAGLSGYVSGGSLIGASLAGSVVSTGVLGGQIWRDDRALLKRCVSWRGMINGLKRYKRFPMIDSSSALLNTVSWQLPVLLLSAFFSPVIVGFYALGMRVLQTPMSFIGSSIAQVFFQRAAEAKYEEKLGMLVENLFKILVKIGLLPVVILLFVGKDLFTVFFGSQWAVAGVYVQILSLWAFVWFISSPLGSIIAVLEKQTWGLFLNIGIFFTRLISLIIGGFMSNVFIALILFSFSGIIVYGYLCIKIFEFSNISKSHMIKAIIPDLFRTIPPGIFLFLLVMNNINSMLIVFISFVIGLIYYSYLYKNEPMINSLINTCIKR